MAGNFFIVIVFVAGLAAGPGHLLWTRLGSGPLMGGHDIQAQGNAFKPVALTLTPEMNPIGIAVRADRYGQKADKAAQLRVMVNNGQSPLADHTVTFAKGGDQQGERQRAGQFSVPKLGVYSFQITGTRPGEPGAVDLRNAKLEVYRKMPVANMKLVWGGVACMVVSVLLFLLSRKKKQ